MKELVRHTANYILSVQQPNGAIPWFADGTIDPWDHVEAAMGLSVAGAWPEAAAAYRWLASQQRPNGSWMAAYQGDLVVDGTRAETNFVAYIATGVWLHYLISNDLAFVTSMWPNVRRAIDFALSLQAPTGEIYWAWDTRTGINKDALLTGCSSIYKSLDCAIRIAELMHDARSQATWQAARHALGDCLRDKPQRFDRTWPSKQRYSMDWFYPVLTGAVIRDEAHQRIDGRWQEFVEPGLGCRCVLDQPWVTVAETAELTMSCLAVGQRNRAEQLFDNLRRFQAEDGSWWTGFAFEDEVLWPDERPTWTAGAVLLAADALAGLTPGSGLFTQHG